MLNFERTITGASYQNESVTAYRTVGLRCIVPHEVTAVQVGNRGALPADDALLFHPVAERIRVQVENYRGAVRAYDNPLRSDGLCSGHSLVSPFGKKPAGSLDGGEGSPVMIRTQPDHCGRERTRLR